MTIDDASSYRLVDGITTYRWLCEKHADGCKAKGWTLELLTPEAPFCDECESERQGGHA